MKVCLWDMVGAGLVIQAESNCVYFNQTGGTACFQSEMEGHFVPFNFDCDPDDFESSLEYKLGQLFVNSESVSRDLAQSIDKLLQNNPETSGVSVDNTKLEDSLESWVYVTIKSTENNPVNYEKEMKGVLTWPNSD
ncbi:hypothetical protein KUV89_05590 [Marinobacter hydrocarbonoclasticus]|nr:hypothetical protein [Marinobacter nauticus]